ncbi:MAG: proline racemase family protein [Gemmatimonadota bacterium]|nr:proline racemase family protein [Gemmatimonadota bacterium]
MQEIPDDWLRIRTIDAHAEGEPLRVIIEGFPHPPGGTVLDRRRYAREHLDDLRRALMLEPRGHADMYGCLVMPPVRRDSDISVLFMHNEGWSTMCGHGVIAATTTLIQMGMADAGEGSMLTIDTPAGRVEARASVDGDRVTSVAFRNVPSFAVALDATVDVPGLGTVRYDLAFGGAFYAYADASALGLDLVPEGAADLIAAGRAIKKAVSGRGGIDHPEDPELGFLYGTIFIGPPEDGERHSRHVCIFADGEVDRSPTGTGVSGRLAILRERGELGDEPIEIESIVGGRFSGRIVDSASVGPYRAVIPEIGGRAFVTGRHEFLIDPEDPWRRGFLIR